MSFVPNVLTNLSSNFDERQWVSQVRQTLDTEMEEVTDIPITIFSVPKALVIYSPCCYTPQQVAVGPYHSFRAELYDMERYKIASAKRSQKELQTVKLEDFVDHVLIKSDLRVRASYHRPLNIGPDTLAWMMAVDACFLFEFFQVCGGVKKGNKVLTKTPSKLSHLIDTSGNKTAHNAILRDIVMLENQIPLFVMVKLLEFQFSSDDLVDELLMSMLIGFCNEISPLKMEECSPKVEVRECAHLLDFLCHFIVPKIGVRPSEIIEIHEDGEEYGNDENMDKNNSNMKGLCCMVWGVLSNIKGGPSAWIKAIIFSKPIKVLVKLPWKILTKIPILKMLKGPLESMFSAFMSKKEEELGSNDNKPPLLEEITIPSVTELFEVGVQFIPTKEGIESIKFDEKTLMFFIPIIELDLNSEVVLRNLVAYEACSTSGPTVLSRYTEFMNGIIDTEEDAKLLCQRGVIVNHLKSEQEVADLWNGMNRSIRLTKVHSLDKVIGDVNKFYNGRWKVKLANFMKQYVFGSWKILTFFGAITLMLLMMLQAFCQVYTCSRFFPINALGPIGDEE